MVERRRKNKEEKTLSEQVEDLSMAKAERPKPVDTSLLIPSGITLLNLACSDDLSGAFVLGQINTMPGGSKSAKTLSMLTMLATCAVKKEFDEYDLYLDDTENRAGKFDLVNLFPGTNLDKRLKSPKYTEDGFWLPSETIQDFKGGILTLCNDSERPFIYVLDSLDSLTTSEELEKEYKKAIANAKSNDAVKELKGSYKTEKAKHLGEALRMINGKLKKTKSSLFIIQQTRDKIGSMFGKKTTTSGGHAPLYYSFHQIWNTKIATHSSKYKSIKIKSGSRIQSEVTKNSLNGKERTIEYDIIQDYGIDDVGANVDFLIKYKHWEKEKNTVIAHDLKMEGTRNKLVENIELEQAEKELQLIVGKLWLEIEDSIRTTRTRSF